ncbi:MAG TPA: AbgT family transporter [Oligoflexia bacterium]|nr:AbgT family transporter [Oligoflexia bacterium]
MSKKKTSTGLSNGIKVFLEWVERTGNKLPDPVFLFIYLTVALVLVSVVCALLGLSAIHPTQKSPDGGAFVIRAASLLSPANIQKFWVDMPATFTHFHPLGYVLVVMLGAGVAERSGLFATAMRFAVSKAPVALLTPLVALIAMISSHAADAGYVVLIPLAGILFAAAGRHPLAGIGAAFAGVSGGFSANITPGQLDALLLGITETAVVASKLDPKWTVNLAGNWWFIIGMTLVFLPTIWFVTDRIIEPRLGKWTPSDSSPVANSEKKNISTAERRGLGRAGWALLGVIGLWVFMVVGPGAPLLGKGAPDAAWYVKAAPLFKSLVSAFFLLFLASGWAYGAAAGTIKNHRDLVKMMADSMKDMGYYLVLAFVAAHFVAMFGWSNLGLIFAIHGANGIESTGLPMPALLVLILLFSSALNILIGSASAKWALMAPVLVPMLMLLGVSPEATTAVYRVGDGATNIITPLMVYFPLVLVFAQKWRPDFGLGSLTALMLPYSVAILLVGTLLVLLWVLVGAELGPNAPLHYILPR